MGVKIKKERKIQSQKLYKMEVKYAFTVPLIGILAIIAMALLYFGIRNVEGMMFAKAFYIIFGLVGIAYTYWGITWCLISDSKGIVARTVLKPTREVSYSDISKVEVIKNKKINDAILSYNLYDNNGVRFASVYTNMRNCGELLVRLKNIGVPIEEISKK